MKQKGRLFETFVRNSDLPAEASPGQPLVEITGEHRVLIENHRGVIGYGCNEICVAVGYGYLRVCGSNLQMLQMTRQQLVITGNIDSVSLCRRQNR